MEKQTQHQKQVEKFMKLANQEVPEFPKIPHEKVLKLRANLILEEAVETINAMGFDISLIKNNILTKSNYKSNVIFIKHEILPDICGIADGCLDLNVVSTGTLSALGIKDAELVNEVNLNNLDKFGEGHSFREDGKLIKPNWHIPPNLMSFIRSLPWSIIIKYLWNRIKKAGDGVVYNPNYKEELNNDIQTLQIDLVLDHNFTLDIGDGKNWFNPNIQGFYIKSGFWNFSEGLSWNGTTIVPDGKPDPFFPHYPITWKASLAHDMGYWSLRTDSSFPYTRKEIDKIFYNLLKDVDFPYATLYYYGVRLFGGIFLRGKIFSRFIVGLFK